MSFKKNFLMMVGASAVAAACTQQPQGIQVQPAPASQAAPGTTTTGDATQAAGTARVVAATPSGATGGAAGGGQTQVAGSQSSSPAAAGAVGMTLNKRDFASYDVSNLSYNFSYLGRTATDRIVFDASNQAVIKITNLPSGQAGTVTLAIAQGTATIMQGTQDGVVLTAGLNNVVNLKLKAIVGSGGASPTGTTDLTIDVSLDNNTVAPGSPGTVINNPPVSTTPGTVVNNPPVSTTPGTVVNNPPVSTSPGTVVNNPPVSTTPPVLSPGGTDPLASWDGKSFLGNSRWNIVPVQ